MTLTYTPRPATTAPRGMVTCPHALASQAGVDVLKAGGSAVDAAIAASSTLAVIYPHMTGLGGDAFWLIYDAKANKVRCLDGGGRAAASASVQWFHERGHTEEIPFRGVLPATLHGRRRAAADPRATYVAMIDHGLDIQTSLRRRPRWLSGRLALGEARDTLHIEARFAAETVAELERRGHVIDRWGDRNELAGHAHGITIDARTGVRCWGV